MQHLYDFQQEQYLPAFIKEFSSSITKEICKELKPSAQPTTLISDIISLIPEKAKEEEIKNAINLKGDSVVAAKNGFLLLLQLFKNNRDQLSSLKEFMSRKGIARDGYMVEGLLTVPQQKMKRCKIC